MSKKLKVTETVALALVFSWERPPQADASLPSFPLRLRNNHFINFHQTPKSNYFRRTGLGDFKKLFV